LEYAWHANGSDRILPAMYWEYQTPILQKMQPDTLNPVIDMMEETKKITIKGGYHEIGFVSCFIKETHWLTGIYGTTEINESMTPSLEFNNEYPSSIEEAGMTRERH